MDSNIKSIIDKIWLTLHSGGVANPLTCIEQITYLLFIKGLDETELKSERDDVLLGIKSKRILVRLDRETANEIFSKYINDNRLNSKQIQFIKQLKEYLIVNGIISLEKLREQPFSTIGSVSDIFKDNINTFNEIKEDIEMINENTIKFA